MTGLAILHGGEMLTNRVSFWEYASAKIIISSSDLVYVTEVQ